MDPWDKTVTVKKQDHKLDSVGEESYIYITDSIVFQN
jgi:hypothetical protein